MNFIKSINKVDIKSAQIYIYIYFNNYFEIVCIRE